MMSTANPAGEFTFLSKTTSNDEPLRNDREMVFLPTSVQYTLSSIASYPRATGRLILRDDKGTGFSDLGSFGETFIILPESANSRNCEEAEKYENQHKLLLLLLVVVLFFRTFKPHPLTPAIDLVTNSPV